MRPRMFVGVTMQSETDCVIGIRDYDGSRSRVAHFRVDGSIGKLDLTNPQACLLPFWGNDLATPPAECRAILEFLFDSGRTVDQMRLCADFEGTVQSNPSAFLSVCILLSRSGFGVMGMRANESQMSVYAPSERFKAGARNANPSFRDLWLLPPQSGRAWAEFTSSTSPSLEQTALTLAEIAGRKHLYYFLSSNGQVQSPSDILYVLENIPPQKQCSVASEEETFVLIKSETTYVEDLSDLSLNYASAAKAFRYLGENHALKFGLLEVCRLYGLQLYCLTRRDGNQSGNQIITSSSSVEPLAEEYRIWPPCGTTPSDVEVEPESVSQKRHGWFPFGWHRGFQG